MTKKPQYFSKNFVIPRKILRIGGIKTKYHRHNGVSVGWVTSFVAEYFLSWLSKDKKNISQEKKISPTNEVIIQRKHVYPYNIKFVFGWCYVLSLRILCAFGRCCMVLLREFSNSLYILSIEGRVVLERFRGRIILWAITSKWKGQFWRSTKHPSIQWRITFLVDIIAYF